ncbi:hypothetical protein GCM10007906_15580 [Vibrio hyugaensis]|uniref:Uncharacterized protein n=1 Tax=Vibrio hyugaensis TaxID=1534743 RepID=A0ABQ5Y3E1_9VIBR|nr:hypothetical protein GCM10007906_15580 [Vibrio hyugaensis]
MLIESLVIESHSAELIHVKESFTKYIEDVDEALLYDLKKLTIVFGNGLINLVGGQDASSAILAALKINR